MKREPFDRLVEKCVWQGDCLVWTGGTVRGLYGLFRPGSHEQDPKEYVHRWLYENTVGPIPDGWEVDHVRARGCRTGLCINPQHLEPVPRITNIERTRLETCRSGRHDLTNPANVQWDSKGRRRGCIICNRERALARYHATRSGGQ